MIALDSYVSVLLLHVSSYIYTDLNASQWHMKMEDLIINCYFEFKQQIEVLKTPNSSHANNVCLNLTSNLDKVGNKFLIFVMQNCSKSDTIPLKY